MEIKIGAAYVRVSTDDQLEYSPESQIKLIKEYAKRDGYLIPEEYIFQDGGISGRSAEKRPAFRLMIATAKEEPPPFSAIFVWKYSRFARNQEEAIMYKNLLRKRNVDVKSISEPSSDSPFASLIERIIEWMDEYYLINLSEEVKRGMTEKAKRGEAMGKAPFGYCVKNKILVPNENAKTVKYIFELYASGVAYREIAIKLEEMGIEISQGKTANSYTISYILRNPVYIGKTRWTDSPNDGHRYRKWSYHADLNSLPDGKHDAIISRELWDNVQKRLSERDYDVKYVQKNNPVIYPLKGLVRCDACGATLVRVGSQKVPSLQCYRYGRGQCKVSHNIKMETIENWVISGIEKAVISESFTFSPLEAVQKPALCQDWNKLIAAEKVRIERAKDAYLNGIFNMNEYAEAKTMIQNNINKYTEQQKKESSESQSSKKPNVAECKEKTLEVLEILKSPKTDGEMKNKALRRILDKIVYNKRENTIDIFFCQ